MSSIKVLFTISLLICCGIAYILGLIWFSDTRNRRLGSFFFLGIEIFFWTLLNAITMVVQLAYFPFVYTLRMIFVCIIPFGASWFILNFIQSPLTKLKGIRAAFFILPAADIACLVTNPFHHLYFIDYLFPIPSRAFLFWIHTATDLLVIVIVFTLLIRFIIIGTKDNPLLFLSGVGLAIPYTINMLYTFRVIVFEYDITPIGFFFTFLLFVNQAQRSHLVNIRTSIFSKTMDSISDSIMIFNERHVITDANKSALDIFCGFPIHFGLTKAGDFFDYLAEASVEIIPADFTDVIKQSKDAAGECTLLSDGGEKETYTMSWHTVSEGKKKTGVIFMMTDVSKYREMITEINVQNDELLALKIEAEAASQAKSAFLSTMSHEIRTPMNAILGITEIQLQAETLDRPVREALDKIYSSGDMLLGIINDILDLSKIEAGKLELLIGQYEVASLISDTAQLNMMRIGSKPIEFELHVDENTPAALFGDELRVKQILNNILSNAFKYTAAGKVALRISAEESDDDGKVVLLMSISDTGQGMSEDQVARIFDEYSRFNAEANRTTEGVGLGMNITRNLVRLMEGEIDIQSEQGKGSVFTVRLPQGKTDGAVLGTEIADNLQKFRTSSRAQMKRAQITREPMPYGSVLIVDDVETNIYVAKGLLAPYGLKIDSTDSGSGAIGKIKNGNEYDIVFMDHMMPVMDGIEATKIIRDLGYKQPIVALTANAVSGQADVFLGSGFDDFISKPIDIRQLNAVLNRLIRDKQPAEVIEEAKRLAEMESGQEKSNAPQSAIDPRLAEIFVRDAKKSLFELETIYGKGEAHDEMDLRSYTIIVHGIKSALANIAHQDLAAVALKLESAARAGDQPTLITETPAFLESLRELIETLAPNETLMDEEVIDDDTVFLREMLTEIAAACETYDRSRAKKALVRLKGKTWSRQTTELLDTIDEQLLHSDFDIIAESIGRSF